MLLEAQSVQTVHDLAVRAARVVERVVRGLTAGARQKAKRGRARIRGRRIELVEPDVEAREDAVVREVRSFEVVVRERADVEDDDVKGRVLRGDPRGQLRDAVLFVVEEGLVPGVHFLGRHDGVGRGRGVREVEDLFVRLRGVGRDCGHRAHRGRGRRKEGLHDEEDEIERRDRRDAHEVPQEIVGKENHEAPAHHAEVDEVPGELHDVVHGKARDSRLVGEDRVDPGEPALRPEKGRAEDERNERVQAMKPLPADRNEKEEEERRVQKEVEAQIARVGERELPDEVDVPDAEPEVGGRRHGGFLRSGHLLAPSAAGVSTAGAAGVSDGAEEAARAGARTS